MDDPMTKFRAWQQGEAAASPTSLYHQFALAALDEFMPELRQCDEQTMDLITRAVSLAVDVTCRAAQVPTSWDPLYEQATAHLRPPE